MEKLTMEDYGMEELTASEMKEVNGGGVIGAAIQLVAFIWASLLPIFV